MNHLQTSAVSILAYPGAMTSHLVPASVKQRPTEGPVITIAPATEAVGTAAPGTRAGAPSPFSHSTHTEFRHVRNMEDAFGWLGYRVGMESNQLDA
jgi:hypothetical protein